MSKRKLDKFINEYIRGLSIDEQEKLLNKMAYEWLPAIRAKFYVRVKKSYTKCPKCGKYFSNRKKLETLFVKETRKNVCIELTPTYDYDDRFADVTYGVKYYICPICGEKVELERVVLKEENVHLRYD